MHENYMKIAIGLAEKGLGFTNPNPIVGAVIVKDGKIIAQGYHEKYGFFHAERNAFEYCDKNNIDCNGADIYVTLEPCCHYGKTPPCTEAIISHGIKRAFIGSYDPNPLVSGNGIKILREHGIEVTEGVLRAECDRINEIFFHYITTKKPFVTLKYAMTMDGKIACFTGESKWITGEAARLNVQKDRLRHSSIMVGVGTVIADNPMLTCRLENGRNPIRIICDTHLRISEESYILKTAAEIPTIIATCSKDNAKKETLEKCGCRVLEVSEKCGHVNLSELMEKLGEMKIDSILIEGGSELSWSALNEGIVNKVQAYIAPKIFGGKNAKTAVAGEGVKMPAEAFMLENPEVKFFGEDILIESRVKNVYGNN